MKDPKVRTENTKKYLREPAFGSEGTEITLKL